MILCSVFILLTIYFWYFWSKKPSRLPPGPWNVPILGSLLWLDSQAPHHSLTKLAQKYGPIYSLQLGKVYTVVVSNANLLKRLLIKEECSERPPLYLIDIVTKGKGIVFTNGELWKNQRKFVIKFFNEIGAGKTLANRNFVQDIIRKSAENFVLDIKKETRYSELLIQNIANILGVLFMEKFHQRDDKEWQHFIYCLRKGISMTGIAGPLNFLPFLRFVPPYKKILGSLREMCDNLRVMNHKIITESETSRFIQSFLKEKSKQKFVHDDEQLSSILLDLYGGGLDTTTETLLWIFLYLAEHQTVQNRVRKELELLQSKPFVMEDLASLPYTEATISEIMRIRTVTPLNIPHYTSKDVEIDGFLIPKGAVIMPVLWSINMDPNLWKNPEEFSPDRFLNQGRFEKPDHFIPFLTGKRICPGEGLAKLTIFTFTVTILTNFKILSKNGAKIDLEGVCGLTLAPKVQDLVFQSVEKVN